MEDTDGWLQKVSQEANSKEGKWLWTVKEEGGIAARNIKGWHQSTLAPRYQGGVKREKPSMPLQFENLSMKMFIIIATFSGREV